MRKIKFLLISLFSVGLYAQEAESLYKEQYSLISLVIQPSFNIRINDNYAYPYKNASYVEGLSNGFSNQLGVLVNAFQAKNWSFRTGLLLKNHNIRTKIQISSANTLNGSSSTYKTSDYLGCNYLIDIPLKADYLLPISNKNNLTFGSTLNIMYNTTSYDTDHYFYVSPDRDPDQIGESVHIAVDYPNRVIVSIDLSAGIQHKTPKFLLELNAYLSLIASSEYANVYYEKTDSYSVAEIGSFRNAPLYYGLSFALTPSKNLFKKKQ